MKNQISESKRKAEGALQTIAGDPTLKGIHMETIWKLIETCIIPIITYACELWDPNKEERGMINGILDNIINAYQEKTYIYGNRNNRHVT